MDVLLIKGKWIEVEEGVGFYREFVTGQRKENVHQNGVSIDCKVNTYDIRTIKKNGIALKIGHCVDDLGNRRVMDLINDLMDENERLRKEIDNLGEVKSIIDHVKRDRMRYRDLMG